MAGRAPFVAIMRILFVAAAIALGACQPPRDAAVPGGATAAPPPAMAPRLDWHCTPQSPHDEADCAARGNGFVLGPPPICHGTQPTPDVEEQERRAYESGTLPCECGAANRVVPCA